MKVAMRLLINNLAGEEGFEPSLRDPESRVLPLDDSPEYDVTESKSKPPPDFSCVILPSIVPHGTPKKQRRLDNKSRVCCPIPTNLSYHAAPLMATGIPPISYCDLRHITKHLIKLGIYGDVIGGEVSFNENRHGVPPVLPAEGTAVLVRMAWARLLSGGGGEPC